MTRNEYSVKALFSDVESIKSATAKDCNYYVKVFDDYSMIQLKYFYDKEDALKYAQRKNEIVGLTAEVHDKYGREIRRK